TAENHYNFDGVAFTLENPDPTSTPTPTLAPTPLPTPTPGQIDFAITTAQTYTFNQPDLADSGSMAVAPGAFSQCGSVVRSLTAHCQGYTDGFGLLCTLNAREGITFYGIQPIAGEEQYIYMKMSVWTNSSSLALAMGALDA